MYSSNYLCITKQASKPSFGVQYSVKSKTVQTKSKIESEHLEWSQINQYDVGNHWPYVRQHAYKRFEHPVFCRKKLFWKAIFFVYWGWNICSRCLLFHCWVTFSTCFLKRLIKVIGKIPIGYCPKNVKALAELHFHYSNLLLGVCSFGFGTILGPRLDLYIGLWWNVETNIFCRQSCG